MKLVLIVEKIVVSSNLVECMLVDNWFFHREFSVGASHSELCRDSDIQYCSNYKSYKFLSHTMKVRERVVEMRVRRGVSIFENSF